MPISMPISRDLAYSLVLECSKQQNLELSRRVSSLIIQSGLDSVSVLGDHLIRLFASAGSLVEANQAFFKVAKTTPYTWNAIIDTHTWFYDNKVAFELYDMMQLEGRRPDKFTFLSLLKVCSARCTIEKGRQIHEQITELGLEPDVIVGSALIHMYAKCGGLAEAHKILNRLSNRNVISWNAMVAGYARHGERHLAIECLERMHQDNIEPNVVTWNAIIAGCAQNVQGLLALECFEAMQLNGLGPDGVTLLSILKACSSIGAIEQSRFYHEYIIEQGFGMSIMMGNTLVDTYAKCGSLEEACGIFDRLVNRDIVSWNAMIAGYVEHGDGRVALDCFRDMQQDESINPDEVTFITALKACALAGAFEHGRHIHEQIFENKLQMGIAITNVLVFMYAKCGNVKEAWKVFDSALNRDVASWNAMITGLAQLGEAVSVLRCFKDMQNNGIEPDNISLVGILAVFGHVGLVEEGFWYFQNLRLCYSIKVDIFHIACMIDLLGHAGCFAEVKKLMNSNIQCNRRIWMSLLDACKLHYNMELGKICFNAIVSMDPLCASAYVLVLNIYENNSLEVRNCDV